MSDLFEEDEAVRPASCSMLLLLLPPGPLIHDSAVSSMQAACKLLESKVSILRSIDGPLLACADRGCLWGFARQDCSRLGMWNGEASPG